jgi:hypothetical protein
LVVLEDDGQSGVPNARVRRILQVVLAALFLTELSQRLAEGMRIEARDANHAGMLLYQFWSRGCHRNDVGTASKLIQLFGPPIHRLDAFFPKLRARIGC